MGRKPNGEFPSFHLYKFYSRVALAQFDGVNASTPVTADGDSDGSDGSDGNNGHTTELPALILQHFERGPKLNDSSNRYQHTCKACGEKFPKGRIDSLTTHLTKKCPAISVADRRKALLELNNLPDIADAARGSGGEIAQANNATVPTPAATNDWSALRTLAEVSRHFNDMNEKQDDGSVHNQSVGAASGTSEPPRGDRLELQEQYTLDNPPVSYEQRLQREKKMLLQKSARHEGETSLPLGSFAPHVVSSRSVSPNLALASAAALRYAPQSMVDPALLGDDVNVHHNLTAPSSEQELTDANISLGENYFNASPSDQTSAWPMLDGTGGHLYPRADHTENNFNHVEAPRAGTYPRLAMNPSMTTEFSAEYGNGQKADKPKVRGRFTPSRRKEVQEVRKLGACIRCRMLKKPCSDGKPCITCANVESARLWKGACIRTKTADDFQMYSAGLHAVLAYHDVNAAKSQALFRISPHQIEVSHYPETMIYATMNALEGQSLPTEGNIDPGLSGDFVTTTLRILDNDNDDLPAKLEAYAKRMFATFFEREPSHFMNVTLNTAHSIAIRSQDELLKRALELWAIVHIFTDAPHWTISERVSIDAPPGEGPAINENASGGTYTVLCMQLNAAAEKKAAQKCKSLLHDLERRLLQRSTTSLFETFLIAIVVLNCVEKSAWLFKSYEQENFKARYPLDKSPATYAAQGEHLANMMQMLLRIRNVPPKIKHRDGILVSDEDPDAKEYFEKLQLSYVDVLNKQANHTFDSGNSRCYELRFCSKLLLPTTEP